MYKTYQVSLYSVVCSRHGKMSGGPWGGDKEARVSKCEAEDVSAYSIGQVFLWLPLARHGGCVSWRLRAPVKPALPTLPNSEQDKASIALQRSPDPIPGHKLTFMILGGSVSKSENVRQPSVLQSCSPQSSVHRESVKISTSSSDVVLGAISDEY